MFQITDSYSCISLPNKLWEVVEIGFRAYGQYQFLPDWTDWVVVNGTTAVLLDRVDLLLCQGMMSARTREIIRAAVDEIPRANPIARAKLAVGLALLSPEGATQR